MTELFLWCALAGGAFNENPAIIDCFDTKIECVEELPGLDCTQCYEDAIKTVCPGYGVSVYE